ncbi:nickel-responsive transcriptional regulator NikR [Sneathiella glossodoripedis]|uniref:nickel-responsive transcriptional regulator NikR n=1 Tax=Sneathiella glossodoripedis TaxID=418853 RepID=UPI00047251BC|nr:nickel-responsive transcriptional regulator NikR [Sneathiella glossodoripedis]
MERITITVEDDLLAEFDQYLSRRNYANRSEGIRDALRHMLSHARDDNADDQQCVGCLSYVYNHQERALSSKLVEKHHSHPDIPAATLHLHIDAEHCMEATILKGSGRQVQSVADEIMSQTGVEYGRLHIIPVK